MDQLINIDFVVARVEHGKGIFVAAPAPATHHIPGIVQAAYLWGTDNIPVLPDQIGGATRIDFPGPGGSRFGLLSFPPLSAGKIDMRTQSGAANLDIGSEPGMHRSNTLDYEFVLSGKIDIVLEGGARRTLRPGSCRVMAGAMRAWENIYDEPCIFGVVVIGAQTTAAEAGL